MTTVKNKTRILGFGMALTALVSVVGCTSTQEPQEPRADEEFVVQIDSVVAPAIVAANETFALEFYGLLGVNLCSVFQRFEATRNGSSLDVTVIGLRKYSQTKCAHAMSELRGKRYLVDPPFGGRFTVVVHQPDGSRLVHIIDVNDP